MTKIISRNFPRMRGDARVDYVFRTFNSIYQISEGKESINKLCKYLLLVFNEGIPDFADGIKGVSELPLLVCEAKIEIDEITSIAQMANARGNGKNQHDILQEYFLENDSFTIAVETPVWSDGTLGHIDLIRVAGDKIEIWDYKPNAHKEKKAASQVLRYRNQLAKLAHLPLKSIRAGYFDEQSAYLLVL